MVEQEIWKEVAGTGGKYEVSNMGRVRSWVKPGGSRRTIPLLLKPFLSGGSGKRSYYLAVRIRGRRGQTDKVHILVAASFIGDRPVGMEINHIDGNRYNNQTTNLEYISGADNRRHAVRNGLVTFHRGVSHYKSKLGVDDIKYIRASDEPIKALGRRFNIDPHAIRQIKKHETYKDVV